MASRSHSFCWRILHRLTPTGPGSERAKPGLPPAPKPSPARPDLSRQSCRKAQRWRLHPGWPPPPPLFGCLSSARSCPLVAVAFSQKAELPPFKRFGPKAATSPPRSFFADGNALVLPSGPPEPTQREQLQAALRCQFTQSQVTAGTHGSVAQRGLFLGAVLGAPLEKYLEAATGSPRGPFGRAGAQLCNQLRFFWGLSVFDRRPRETWGEPS